MGGRRAPWDFTMGLEEGPERIGNKLTEEEDLGWVLGP